MTVFSFRAYDAKGRIVEGEIESTSRDAVLADLRRRGAYPVEVTQKRALGAMVRSRATSSLSADALVLVTRELATLIEAHLPIDEALRIAALQPLVPTRARLLLDEVRGKVESGQALSDALASQAGSFPAYYTSLIAASERGGTLGASLSGLAAYLERRADLARRVRGALLYPLILMGAAMAALGVVIGVLVPAVAPLFDDAGVSPPPVIAVLRWLQGAITGNWPVILALLAGVAIATARGMRNPILRAALDRFALGLPLVGRMIAHGETARLAQTVATLLGSGVALLDALRVATGSLGSAPYRAAAGDIAEHVSRGGAFATGLAASGLFTPLAVRLVEIGERTGELEAMLSRLGRIEDDALRQGLDRGLALLAPVLTVVVGLVVGGILLSVMGAILSLNDLVAR